MLSLALFWVESEKGQFTPVWHDPRNIERIEPYSETTSLLYLRGDNATAGGDIVYGSAYNLAVWLAKPQFDRPTPPRHLRRGYAINGDIKSAEQLAVEVSE